jgi:Ca2+-binding EF-hand superfamily protein
MYKPEVEIKELVMQMESKGSLDMEEYQQIVLIILNYNQTDIKKFEKFSGGWAMSYAQFIEKLLRFRLEKYENGLKHFNNLFHKFDDDEDGILTIENLVDLLDHLETSTKGAVRLDVKTVLFNLDPLKTDVINYSHLVAYFLNYTIERHGRKISFIQFLKEING